MAWKQKQTEPHNCYVTLSVTAREKQALTVLAEHYHTTPSILARKLLALALRRLQAIQQEAPASPPGTDGSAPLPTR